MATPTQAAAAALRWRGASVGSRRAYALPLSIGLHLMVLLALSRLAWPTATSMPEPARPSIVWRGEWHPPPSRQAAPTEPEATQSPAEPEAQPRARRPAAPKPAPAARKPAPPVEQPPSSSVESAPPAAPAPEIDWEAAQQQAVSEVLEEQAHTQAFREFSPDDVIEAAPPRATPDPVTRKMFDGCHVMTHKAQGLAWGVLTALTGGLTRLVPGFCMRAAHQDLFAAVKPDYLSKRPYCAGPDGKQVSDVIAGQSLASSSIKCRLVTEEEYAALTASGSTALAEQR